MTSRSCDNKESTADVLVVEDDVDIRESFELMLSIGGYCVHAANHGRDALDKLRDGLRPALILLDVMMPVMDATGFRQAQLASEELAAIPVVLVSGASDLPQRARELRVDGYLRKPFTIQRILDIVNYYV
jgi:CheY-like chemotaxis protein